MVNEEIFQARYPIFDWVDVPMYLSKDSWPSYAQFLHFRPGNAVMEEILLW
jgi:hypothetical protein